MKYLFLQYPQCSTCRNARKWLTEHGIDFEDRPIVEQKPTEEELRAWIERSGLPITKFFNASGLAYRSLGLKDKLPVMTDQQKIRLLSSDGMLVKRPLLIGENGVLAGFRIGEWESMILVTDVN